MHGMTPKEKLQPSTIYCVLIWTTQWSRWFHIVGMFYWCLNKSDITYKIWYTHLSLNRSDTTYKTWYAHQSYFTFLSYHFWNSRLFIPPYTTDVVLIRSDPYDLIWFYIIYHRNWMTRVRLNKLVCIYKLVPPNGGNEMQKNQNVIRVIFGHNCAVNSWYFRP